MEENKPVTAVPVLPCGHEMSFEHELVDLLLGVVEYCIAKGADPVKPCMDVVREVFAYCYLQIPTYDELMQIKLSHKMDNKSTEVN